MSQQRFEGSKLCRFMGIRITIRAFKFRYRRIEAILDREKHGERKEKAVKKGEKGGAERRKRRRKRGEGREKKKKKNEKKNEQNKKEEEEEGEGGSVSTHMQPYTRNKGQIKRYLDARILNTCLHL